MTRQSLELSPILQGSPIHSNQNVDHIAATSTTNTPIIPERPPSPEKKAFHDSNTFLTALAAQERRVLGTSTKTSFSGRVWDRSTTYNGDRRLKEYVSWLNTYPRMEVLTVITTRIEGRTPES